MSMKIQVFSHYDNTMKHKKNGAVHYLLRGIQEYGDEVYHIVTEDPQPFFKKPKPNIIVLQGTFDDEVRATDSKVHFRQLVKDYAYEQKIPLLVLETNTASRVVEQPLVSIHKFHRVAFQHWLFGKGYFFEEDYKNDRWERLKAQHNLKVTPWKNHGEYILLLLGYSQDPTNDLPPIRFCLDKIPEIRRYTDLPIVIRFHPLEQIPENFINQFQNMSVTIDSNKSILQSLEKAKMAVMYNSTSIFQTVYSGVPVIVGVNNFASEVASMSISEINSPKLFDQEEWFARMAYTEWTREEMATPIFWERWRGNYYRYKEMINVS